MIAFAAFVFVHNVKTTEVSVPNPQPTTPSPLAVTPSPLSSTPTPSGLVNVVPRSPEKSADNEIVTKPEPIPEAGSVAVVKKTITVAEPLVHREPASVAVPEGLTPEGVFAWSNVDRVREGVGPVFTRNPTLDEVAHRRALDMFTQQYFEHSSPQGTGASDVATALGYSYIGVGENIALGNYKNDEVIVTAWMNSPGHRANILNPKFVDLGVAVIRGTYKGDEVWIGVQIFGRPLSQCPAPDPNLNVKIEQNKNQLNILDGILDSLDRELQVLRSSEPLPVEIYNRKISEYNELVGTINPLSAVTKSLVLEYNGQVDTFNVCVAF